ncbi:MAG: acyl-CoA dehydrogenase family protein [Beijerinckiaceae bacterium]
MDTDILACLDTTVPQLVRFGELLRERSRTLPDNGQQLEHGLAWYATSIRAFQETANWLRTGVEDGWIGSGGLLTGRILLGELLAECRSGVVMHQLETVRPGDFGVGAGDLQFFEEDCAARLIREASSVGLRSQLVALISQGAGGEGDFGLEGEPDARAMTEEIRRFSDAEIVPRAHGWHVANAYIPEETIAGLAALGVFGICVPEENGGAGASKTAMCAITEELARAYIGAGSLGTRSEIAAELILAGGRGDQKALYLPRIASGEILPAAAFTEPEAGSDLGSVRCMAIRDGDSYLVNGAKIWITHAARADLLTLLVRTDPAAPGYRGLSMLLIEKPRGTDADPFPVPGMSGSEIEVIGYRGMKEYEIGFQDFRVPASALLGEVEGQGFRQLMQTFETARIQTAARATGVARSAADHALAYAMERRQFGKRLIDFPRVSNKIVKMHAEILAARLLTLAAARAKDAGHRCDLEAGMAKLYAARVAWSAADGAVQIHGGNGFAVATPVSRILCDARILSIFEGAAEIQAQIIARRLLES